MVLAVMLAPLVTFAGQPAGGLGALLDNARDKSAQGTFLNPDAAFQVSATASGSDRVRIDWTIADGYYLYRARIKVGTAAAATLGALQLPEGETKTDEYFGTQQIYHHTLTAYLPVSRPGQAALELPLAVTYQGCATAGLCYPPITRTLNISLPAGAAASPGATTTPAAPPATQASAGQPAAGAADTRAGVAGPAAGTAGFVSQQDRLAGLIRNGNLLLVLGTFFGLGLLLAFTPCVLPMVPILSGIIAGHGANITTRKAFALSLTYVLGMALTYTLAGVAVAAAGSHVQALFQQTWIIVLFALLFVALAFSMLGAFTLQMPSAIQTALSGVSGRQTAGSFAGVAVMGALSALIVTTCVAPPLVATLAVIGASGNIARGAAALFSMSLGMGAPLLLVGASAGSLLPRAGVWMDTVKKLFGVLMLAVAAWMLSRVCPPWLIGVLWLLPAISLGWVLWSMLRNAPLLSHALAVLASLALLLTGSAATGGPDPVSRLLHGPQRELTFQTIRSTADLDREVAQAHAGGLGVMLDFYADWCVSCKEMEKDTFTDPAVRAALHDVVLLRADVTANNADDQALFKRFGIFGPPTIAFYGPDGQERARYRVVGYMKPPQFAAVAREAAGRTASGS